MAPVSHREKEMKLVQAKIRGLGTTIESRWVEFSPGVNLIIAQNLARGEGFLTSLQTINPPYSFDTVSPFEDFPEHYIWQGQERRVIPAKRTVAIGVFGAEPELVITLGKIDNVLYETDRIEVGRRLDYSRWINFVEIAASTRWGEISDSIATLIESLSGDHKELRERLLSISKDLSPSDRIVQDVQQELLPCLEQIEKRLTDTAQKLASNLIVPVLRTTNFKQARQIVSERLPLFSLIEAPKNLDTFEQEISRAIKSSRHTFQTEPILLFNAPEKSLSPRDRNNLPQLLLKTAKQCQCLYLTDDENFLQNHNIGKRYFLEELEI
jgi:hypothetical protein